MSKRYKGAILSSTPPTTSTSSASGVWTEQQFMQGVASGSWPALAGAPTIGTATAGALSASVTFTAPTYTGSGITGYTVTSNPGGITGTGASSPITVSGLTEGTAYTFTVTATTAAGQGPASAASNSVTPTAPNYIEDVFSTYLYTGNGSTQTITNGIDLAGKGGLVWQKLRDTATSHALIDTARGGSYYIESNSTFAQDPAGATTFNSNGYSLGSGNGRWNANGYTYASWTFRKQPKFFDVVTYTGNGVVGRQIAHSLGSAPGFIVVKNTVTSGPAWTCYHRSLGATKYLYLNATMAEDTYGFWDNTDPTSTYFVVGGNNVENNANGQTYVAYLFAHNAGGFGLTGTDNVISCGSYTTDGSGNFSVNLGYEPQWIMAKRVSSTGDWTMFDTMRGLGVDGTSYVLYANVSNAESGPNSFMSINSTGFGRNGGTAGQTFIYIAIRRGPMKVPTSGTSVFNSITRTGTNAAATVTTGNLPDWVLIKKTAGSNGNNYSRLTGPNRQLYTDLTLQEIDQGAGYGVTSFLNTAFTLGLNANNENQNGASLVNYAFSRAPSFFDEVCYTGNGTSSNNQTHNLTVVPELVIYKNRTSSQGWYALAKQNSTNSFLWYQNAFTTSSATTGWVTSDFCTATTIQVGDVAWGGLNDAFTNYVAYLFATCPGVSKVGSYTGTGATQTINCGFSAGARWVLIKRTDSTGDWYVWDTARGMVSGTDPSLLLNSSAAEVNANSVYTTAVGFQIVSTASGINASGGTYIFLAIA